jgi:phytoene desaturase
MYLGVRGRIRAFEHHNLFLERDWYEHFDSIFRRRAWPKRPSYYICAPSKTDPTVAPPECENLFVLVPVASELEDTDEIRSDLGERVLGHMEELCNDRFRPRIEYERFFAHRDFSASYNSLGGSALGLAHTLRQTAVFRPSRRSKRVENLFYTGHFTHPGIGVPMTVMASTLVTEEIGDA